MLEIYLYCIVKRQRQNTLLYNQLPGLRGEGDGHAAQLSLQDASIISLHSETEPVRIALAAAFLSNVMHQKKCIVEILRALCAFVCVTNNAKNGKTYSCACQVY